MQAAPPARSDRASGPPGRSTRGAAWRGPPRRRRSVSSRGANFTFSGLALYPEQNPSDLMSCLILRHSGSERVQNQWNFSGAGSIANACAVLVEVTVHDFSSFFCISGLLTEWPGWRRSSSLGAETVRVHVTVVYRDFRGFRLIVTAHASSYYRQVFYWSSPAHRSFCHPRRHRIRWERDNGPGLLVLRIVVFGNIVGIGYEVLIRSKNRCEHSKVARRSWETSSYVPIMQQL